MSQGSKLRDDAKILDVGCGRGFLLYEFTRLLPNCTVAGFDVSAYGLATAKEEVEAILTRQRRFVSDVAHEIGTPLTTLSGNMAVLESGVADDPTELRETLQDLSAEFSRLSGIFSHLMVLAEADERNQIVRRPVSLDRLVNDVAMMWGDRASH